MQCKTSEECPHSCPLRAEHGSAQSQQFTHSSVSLVFGAEHFFCAGIFGWQHYYLLHVSVYPYTLSQWIGGGAAEYDTHTHLCDCEERTEEKSILFVAKIYIPCCACTIDDN